MKKRISPRKLPGSLRLFQAAALLLLAVCCLPIFAETASSIVEHDGAYFLYRDGKPLTAGYDALEMKDHPGFPGLVIARRRGKEGMLEASTGRILLPVIYQNIDTDTLEKFGLVQARDGKTTRFFASEGQPAEVPAYDAVGNFSAVGEGRWKALAERHGNLLEVTLGNGRLMSENPAPKYLPIIVLPPGMRPQPTNPDGPLNGTYVAAPYPDLKSAWEAWKQGKLREPGQPAIVIHGDVAYVSFAEFKNAPLPQAGNTLSACQTDSGVTLRKFQPGAGCTVKSPVLFRLQLEHDHTLRCEECGPGIPPQWHYLPPVIHSLVGIGVALKKSPDNTSAIVVGVMPKSPAAQAGLEPGDKVVAVDSQSTAPLSLTQIVERIRGQAGTSVKLNVHRESRQFVLDVKRQSMNVSENIEDR